MLIGNEGVQKELKLDDQQVEKAKEFAEKAREEMREHFAEACRDSRAKSAAPSMQEINKEMNESAMKAFGEFLKPEQITRLKQISYHQTQEQGVRRSRGRQEAEPDRHPEERNPRRSCRESMEQRCARSATGRTRTIAKAIDEEDGRDPQGNAREGHRQAERRTAEDLERADRCSVRIQVDPRPAQ